MARHAACTSASSDRHTRIGSITAASAVNVIIASSGRWSTNALAIRATHAIQRSAKTGRRSKSSSQRRSEYAPVEFSRSAIVRYGEERTALRPTLEGEASRARQKSGERDQNFVKTRRRADDIQPPARSRDSEVARDPFRASDGAAPCRRGDTAFDPRARGPTRPSGVADA